MMTQPIQPTMYDQPMYVDPVLSQLNGMPINDATGVVAEPRHFQPRSQLIEISTLPPPPQQAQIYTPATMPPTYSDVQQASHQVPAPSSTINGTNSQATIRFADGGWRPRDNATF